MHQHLVPSDIIFPSGETIVMKDFVRMCEQVRQVLNINDHLLILDRYLKFSKFQEIHASYL